MTDTTLLHRTVAAEIKARDGREVYGRILPYGERARANPDPPGLPFAIDRPYVEMFESGQAWVRHASRAADRVALSQEHVYDGTLGTQLGYGTQLVEESDGVHAAFRVFNTSDGDKALELIDAKVYRAFSVGFIPLARPKVLDDGTIVRTKIRLDECTLCREGAYPGAEVHGRRTKQREAPVEAEAWSLRDRLKSLGYVPENPL